MEEYTQITLTEWLSWKEDIRKKLQETAGNFVHIGYRLKQIRDSGMYDGCQDIFEFAQKEYGLSKSTVSRFIAINEKFSEGGNSLELREEFRNIGSSKLSEMLTLPDADCALITERTTVKEIRELKEFNRQAVPVEELEEAEEEPVATSQQNPEDIVDTEAETDPGEAEEPARQQEILQISESEKKYREQILYMAVEIQACIRKAEDGPLTMQEVRSAHSAARKMLTALDRLYDVKEHEIGEIEGQMTLEDMEDSYVSE